MKKVLVLIVILGVLFVAGDAWARGKIEGRLASELQGSLGSTGDIEVSLGGFPFVLRALSGNIPTASVATERMTRDGLRFTDVTMTLRDIRFSLSKVLAGDLDAIKVGSGEGRAAIDSDVLGRAIARSGRDVDVEIVGNGIRITSGPVSGVVDVSVSQDGLVLETDELGLLAINELGRRIVVPLPRIVGGLTYESIQVVDFHLELGFALDDVRLTGL